MKCDELKAMSAVDAYEEYENNILDESKHYYYNKQDVDEAIAELEMTIEKIGMPKDYCVYCSHRYTTICQRCSNGSHRVEREGWLQQHKRHINNQQRRK